LKSPRLLFLLILDSQMASLKGTSCPPSDGPTSGPFFFPLPRFDPLSLPCWRPPLPPVAGWSKPLSTCKAATIRCNFRPSPPSPPSSVRPIESQSFALFLFQSTLVGRAIYLVTTYCPCRFFHEVLYTVQLLSARDSVVLPSLVLLPSSPSTALRLLPDFHSLLTPGRLALCAGPSLSNSSSFHPVLGFFSLLPFKLNEQSVVNELCCDTLTLPPSSFLCFVLT